MSDAYERERQNNSRLSELSAKITALRGVTVDIYDNARSQDVIDNTVRLVLFKALPFWWCCHPRLAPFLSGLEDGSGAE
jgi:hypothetical protein